MEIEKELCATEMRKVALLMARCVDDGVDLSSYGTAGVNKGSGNVYIWTEDMRSVPYIGPCGNKIQYLRSCPNCGEEVDVEREHRDDDMKCSGCGEDM